MGTRIFEKILTFIFDFVAISLAFAAAFFLRYKSGVFPSTYDPNLLFADYRDPMLILSGTWLILFFLTGLYRDWYKESRVDEFFVVCRTVLFGAGLLFLIISADDIITFARTGVVPHLFSQTRFTVLATYIGCVLVMATLNRFLMHTLLAWFFARGIWVSKMAIIGADDSSHSLIRSVHQHPQLGCEVVGFFDKDGAKKNTVVAGHPVFGDYSDMPETIKRERITGLIISHMTTDADDIMDILRYTAEQKVSIYMVPSMLDVISGHYKTQQIFGVPLMVLLQDHMPGWEAQLKRLMDIAVSMLVLSIGAPFWAIVYALVKLTSPGPAVFRQERIGQNGKPFVMMKFRSMYIDAETRSGPVWATENDPRITPFGRFMRKTRLDEIPQFINVLRGEMSLVGPRPERAFFIEKLTVEIPWYIRRIKMKPGITGWAQVKHKYDETIDDVRQKVMYDLYYFENMSILLDIKILLRTIMVVFTGKGAH